MSSAAAASLHVHDHDTCTGSREEWLTARLALLDAEKELTRRRDGLACRRLELPWVRVEKDDRFDTDDGEAKGWSRERRTTTGTMFLVAARLAFTRALRKATTKRT